MGAPVLTTADVIMCPHGGSVSLSSSQSKVMAGGGECANVDWTMLGISMPGWVLIAAVCLGLVGILNNAVYPVRVRR